jgi:hypothetical protein
VAADGLQGQQPGGAWPPSQLGHDSVFHNHVQQGLCSVCPALCDSYIFDFSNAHVLGDLKDNIYHRSSSRLSH